MNILFRICSLLCIAANIQISLQARNFQLEENAKPDVNCLLFGNIGCHSTCALIGKLFVQGGEGSCDASYTCGCKLYQPTSVDDIWYSKFDRSMESTDLLNQLKIFQEHSNYLPYRTILDTVKDPFLTNKKAKKLLKDFFPTSKLTNALQPSNGQLISTYVDDIDNFNQTDSTKLSSFVETELKTIPENITDEIARNNYKERMNEFVNKVNDIVTINYVTKQLEMISGLPFITEMLKKLEEKQKLLSAQEDEEEGGDQGNIKHDEEKKDESSKKVTDAISAFVTKELISQADKNQKSPKINRNKSSQSNSSKSGSKFQKKDDRDSLRNTGKGKSNTPNANKTKSKYSSSQWKPSVRAINNTADGYGGVKREWKGNNSYIKYSKDMYGTSTVNWKSNDVTITLKYTYMGDVIQTWKFGDVVINLNNDYMGNIDHKWDFGNTQYIYSKLNMGDESDGWTGIEDFDTLSQYENYIKSWCSQNTDLFPKKCVLFKY